MEIEKFWECIPQAEGPMKDKEGKNYGFAKKGDRKYTRQIRRKGFDDTELWNLDCTIIYWLADNFGGFWKYCTDDSSWIDYDLEGNYHEYMKERDKEGYIEECLKWETTRYDSFYAHLRDFLDNLDEETKKKFSGFCCPRLRRLAKIVHGYPADKEFPTYKSWINGINDMADALEKGTYTETFITHFFHLWD